MITLKSPNSSDIHIIADYCEIICLLTPDRTCSSEDIRDHFKELDNKAPSENDMTDAFSQLEWRWLAFGKYYPFEIEKGRIIRANDHLSNLQEAYVTLLLCSNLRLIPDQQKCFTDTFERISLKALECFMPAKSKLIPFGKVEGKNTYPGKKHERINLLAKDLGAAGICTEDMFRAGDSGDGGIDLAAWLEIDRFENRHLVTAIAQCGCSRDNWANKHGEISNQALSSKIVPTSPWLEMVFIPHCFRNNHGKWAVAGDIRNGVLIDRLRIVMSMDENNPLPDNNHEPELREILEQRLDLV